MLNQATAYLRRRKTFMNSKKASALVATILVLVVTAFMVPLAFAADSGIDNVFFIANGLPGYTTVTVSYSGTAPDGESITDSSETFTTRRSGSGASSAYHPIQLLGNSLLKITFPTIAGYSYTLTIGGPGLPATVIPFPYEYTLPPSISINHPTLYWIKADYTPIDEALAADVWTADATVPKDTFGIGEQVYLHWTSDPIDSVIHITVVDQAVNIVAGPYVNQQAGNSPITFALYEPGTYTILVNGEPEGYLTTVTFFVVPESVFGTLGAISAGCLAFAGFTIAKKHSKYKH